MNVPILEMERLESKYNVDLNVTQYEDGGQDDYYIIINGDFFFVGHTIDEVEKNLGDMYGNTNL